MLIVDIALQLFQLAIVDRLVTALSMAIQRNAIATMDIKKIQKRYAKVRITLFTKLL